jgi:hypothetical protein
MPAPSPFQRVLTSTALTYQDWWYCMKYCRTEATARKLYQREHARIAKGCTTNRYGDLTSHAADLTRIDGRHGIGQPFYLLQGFSRHKRKYYPQKSKCWITTPLLDAVTRARNLANAIEAEDRQLRLARQQGFVSVKAMQRNEKHLAAIRVGCEHLFTARKKTQEHRLLSLIHTLDQIRTGKVAVHKLDITDIDLLLQRAEKEVAAARASLTMTFATLGKRKLAA